MKTVVDILFEEFSDIQSILDASSEISLRNTLEDNFRKTLLLSAASFFETVLVEHVVKFCAAAAQNNDMVCTLIRIKAIERQYHTWFDWKQNNANKFFSLFGNSFKEFVKQNSDHEFDSSIKNFIEIGRNRNQMVHENYAAAYIEKTTEEIYDSYKSAKKFVDRIPVLLSGCAQQST